MTDHPKEVNSRRSGTMIRSVGYSIVLLSAAILFGVWWGVKQGPEVVVYTSLDPVFSRTILADFEKETGIVARPVFDTEATKTTGLIERLRRERNRPLCDVLWSNEPLRTIRLANEGLFAPHASISGEAIPENFRDATYRWTGFAARARVAAFDPKRLDPSEAPGTLEELLDPKFRGEVAIADPRFGTTGSHCAALLAWWGEDRYRDWLRGLVENEVQVVAGNSTSRDRVLSGEALIGLTDTDDVEVARRAGDSIDESFFPDEGTLVLPNTVAMVAGSSHSDSAIELIEYLLSPECEATLAASPSRQIPLRAEVPIPVGGLKLEEVKQMPVTLEAAASVLPRAIEIAVEELGL